MNNLSEHSGETIAKKHALLKKLLLEKAQQKPASATIPRRSDNASIPLSFSQERLWFLDQLLPNRAVYNVCLALRLVGVFDIAVLQKSINEVIKRHEALRTNFVLLNERPVQVIHSRLPLSCPMVDLHSLSSSNLGALINKLITEEREQPFDLAQDALLRATVFRLSAHEHILLFVTHHINFDGWSINILTRELIELYEALVTKREAKLPHLPVQYADYALWQRQRLQGATLESLLAYWREQLVGLPELLALPTDYPRPAQQQFQGRSLTVTWPESLRQRLHALSQEEGVSLFMTLLAGLQVLLWRYSGQEDLAVGVPVAQREQPEVESLIGLLVNTLVLRADLSGTPTVRELLQRVRQVALDAYAHQDLPFEHLVEALAPRRSLSHSPLFQVFFAFHGLPLPELELPHLKVNFMEIESSVAKFDLALEVREVPEGLWVYLEYDTCLFERATMLKLLSHWQRVLEGMVEQPDAAIHSLPLLTPAEWQHLVHACNQTRRPWPPEATLLSLLTQQQQRIPDAIALMDEHAQLSYTHLLACVEHLAGQLRQRGVGAEVRVGVCLPRSASLVVSLLGVLAAGGAYVPLDPQLPAARLQYLLHDAQVHLVLACQQTASCLPADCVPLLLDDWTAVPAAPWGALPPAHPEQLAYVLYTSGSTGQPKGVQIAQQSLCNFLLALGDCLPLRPHEVGLALTTCSFDIAALEYFLLLLHGGRIVLSSEQQAHDGQQLAELLAREHITLMQATPSTWHLLLLAGWAGEEDVQMLCGGEALSMELAQQLLLRGRCLWNLYGPTETTIWSTLQQVQAGEPGISLGHPIANTQVYVLDSWMQPVPVGVVGELYIGGQGVARGYLNRPQETADRFVPDPWSQEGGARLYRSGDLVRWREGGQLEFVGRADQQVKLRGHRIELGEIEAILQAHPAIQRAAVLLHARHSGDPYLVAYIIPESGQEPTTSELQHALRQKVPLYMVPSTFVLLDKFPYTPNGKLNREALLRSGPTLELQQEDIVEPRTSLEKELVDILKRVLDIPQIGIYNDFFALGGHSLTAIQALSHIKAVLNVNISLRDFFEASTVAELAQRIEQLEQSRRKVAPLYAYPRKAYRAANFTLDDL